MNTPVSFELAKLLKEKGFDKPTHSFYVIDESEYGEISEFITNPNDNYPALDDNSLFDSLASAPTIAEIVMWLYEKHGFWIMVDFAIKSSVGNGFGAKITQKNHNVYIIPKSIFNNRNFSSMKEHFKASYKSPTEAYEAAIEYVLKNLI